MADVPVACTLSPDALETRRDGLLAELLQRAEHHELTEHGLRVRFAPVAEAVAPIARLVDAERQCCRFLRFVVTVEPDGGPWQRRPPCRASPRSVERLILEGCGQPAALDDVRNDAL